MSAKEFLKENFVIVIGVTLPLLLVLFFAIARELPESRVPDPQYDLVFAKNYPHGMNKRLEFTVENKKIKVRYYPEETNEHGYVTNRNIPELFYYDADKHAVREIPIELPVDEDGKISRKVQYIEVPAVAGLEIDAGNTAPDGYQFVYQGHNRGGLMTDIMIGYRGGRYQYVLEKDGRRIELPSHVTYYNTEAVGWVVGGELKD